MKKKTPLSTFTLHLHLLLCLLLAPRAFAEATLWGNTLRSLGFGYLAKPCGCDSIAIGDWAMDGATNADSCVAIGTGALSLVTNSYGVIAIGNYQFSGAGDLTNVTAIGNHFFASGQTDTIVLRAAEEDPLQAPFLYGANHLYLNATNGVWINGRQIGAGAFGAGGVTSVNGQTGAVSVTCSSIGALASDGEAMSANYAYGASYARLLKPPEGSNVTDGEYEIKDLASDDGGIPRLGINVSGTDYKVAFKSEIPTPFSGNYTDLSGKPTIRDLSGATYDFQNGTNFTLRLYTVLTNIIDRLGGSVTNAPSFD